MFDEKWAVEIKNLVDLVRKSLGSIVAFSY